MGTVKIMYKIKNKYEFLINYPERILPITFFLLCLFGGILLSLPFCHKENLSIINAIFTSVSAVCVTGLSVVDIGEKLTNFGQLVLLFLIQAGGLGIMTISSIIFILLGKRVSLMHEKTIRNIFDARNKEEIKTSLILIFKYTFLVELIGMFILTIGFSMSDGFNIQSVKYAVFTSVSAFCNAGFFLRGNNLIDYYSNPVVLYSVSFLIILGGIAPVICVSLIDLLKKRKLNPLSRIVFITTMALIFAGTLFFFVSEYYGVLIDMNFADKFNNAWFQSVTARTAGFNSVDISNIYIGTYLSTIILMIIGGSPGSTAGGIKTTTFAVLILTCLNTLKRKENTVKNRKIKPDTVQKAITLTIMYLFILFLGILMLLTTQISCPHKLIFEAVSALGTVGLSMGSTVELDSIGKIIIIAMMFLGRVFPATLLCYLKTKDVNTKISYPDTNIPLT